MSIKVPKHETIQLVEDETANQVVNDENTGRNVGQWFVIFVKWIMSILQFVYG